MQGEGDMNALLPILTKFGQWNDLIISQLQAIFQPFSSYPPLGTFLSSQLISMRDKRNGGFPRRSVYSLKIVAKSFGNGSLDICKYKESNLEPFADF